MPFNKGRRKSGGRRRGTPNKFTGTFREALQVVYDGLGGHDAFLAWARKNRTEYYRIAARVIPVEIREKDSGSSGPTTIIVQQFTTPEQLQAIRGARQQGKTIEATPHSQE